MNDPTAPGTPVDLSADRPVTVLLAEDEELTRTGLHLLLSGEPGLSVVGEATTGVEVLPLAAELCPDVVLMDVRMPGMNGIEATRLLREHMPAPPKVVVITTFNNDDYVYEALRAGAAGFLLKRDRPAQIAHAIRLVASGDSILFPDAVRRLVTTRPRQSGRPGAPALTPRETEVLRLMAAGLTNHDIATTLVIGLETVKTHVTNLFAKLGAQNRTQAVILAYEYGIAAPGDTPPSQLR